MKITVKVLLNSGSHHIYEFDSNKGQIFFPRIDGAFLAINTYASDGSELLDLFPANALQSVITRELNDKATR